MALTGTQSYILGMKHTDSEVVSTLTGVASWDVSEGGDSLILTTNDGAKITFTPPGTTGKSIEYKWDGQNLGIRVEGETEYQWQDLGIEINEVITVGTTADEKTATTPLFINTEEGGTSMDTYTKEEIDKKLAECHKAATDQDISDEIFK